jgi:hypothetical protein
MNALDMLIKERDKLQPKFVELGKELYRIERAIKALEDTQPVSPISDNTEFPHTISPAVRLILKENPLKSWRVNELIDELKKRGITIVSKNPYQAVRQVLARELNTKQVVRIEQGVFKWNGD